MVRYITLDETGKFEKFAGTEKVRLVGGLIIDAEEQNSLKSEIRKLLIRACEEFNNTLAKENSSYMVIYPRSLHGGDKNKILYNADDKQPVEIDYNQTLNDIINRFNDFMQDKVLRFIKNKIRNAKNIKVYEYIYPSGRISNDENIQTNILNTEIGSNLYERMAILSMFNNVFGRLEEYPDNFSFHYATRVYDVNNLDETSKKSFEKLYTKTQKKENEVYIITDESTYKSALSERLYELPIDSIFNKINYEFNVESINYKALKASQETPLLYITDIICGFLKNHFLSHDKMGFKTEKLLGLPDFVETRIYSDTDRIYTAIVNNLRAGNICDYYSSLYDYSVHNSSYKQFYDDNWIPKLEAYYDKMLSTDKEFQNDYINSLNEYYSVCEKLTTSKSDYNRGLFIAKRITEDITKMNDPKFVSNGRSAFLNSDYYGKNMFRFYDIFLRGINHQGAVTNAERIVSECDKYKTYVGTEEYIEHKLRVVQYMFNSFQYRRITDVYLKNVIGGYRLGRWEESPVEKLKAAMRELSAAVSGEVEENVSGYLLAGKIYSTLAQAYSFIECSEKTVGAGNQAEFYFEKALEEMEKDRINRDITLTYKIHFYIDMEDRENFYKSAAEYFEVDKFNFDIAADVLMQLIKEDTSGFRFALYILIKAIRVFYIKENLQKVEQLYVKIYQWMVKEKLTKSFMHPWELIYKNMYEIGEYISVKRNRSKLINAAMFDMKNQLFEIAKSESTGPTITAIIAAFKLRISKEAEVSEILSDTELSKLREIECLADADRWSKEELYENLRKRLSYMYN